MIQHPYQSHLLTLCLAASPLLGNMLEMKGIALRGMYAAQVAIH